MANNIIELKNIKQVYKTKGKPDMVLFDDLNLTIEDKPDKGQFVILMGASGCGKSTVLRYITNLQKPDSGEILFKGKPLTPEIHIPMVFQMYSSLEWYSVYDNIALPLVLQGKPQAEIKEKVDLMLEVVGLTAHKDKYAKYPLLSGGQLQRVAIARSLVANPETIVMDEPFSALDSVTRRKLQNSLKLIYSKARENGLDPTFILVTHDAREAAYLADDIFIMAANPGSIKQHIQVDFPDIGDELKKTKDYLDLVDEIEANI